MLEPGHRLLLGLGTGLVFGFLLQKGQVAKYRTILGQLLLEDWTVVKVMGTAVLVGSVGIFVLRQGELTVLHLKPTLLGGVLTGGGLFGVGMALLGYCPGTSVAACGEGRRDAIAGVIGQLLGGFVFVLAYGRLEPWIERGDLGTLTLPGVTGLPPWTWIAALGIAGLVLLLWRRSRRSETRRPLRVMRLRGGGPALAAGAPVSRRARSEAP